MCEYECTTTIKTTITKNKRQQSLDLLPSEQYHYHAFILLLIVFNVKRMFVCCLCLFFGVDNELNK